LGIGKSTAMTLAQTVWGHPKAGAMLSDTMNSVVRKLGLLNNLPIYFDEARGDTDARTDKAWANLPYLLSQGRERTRLTRGSKLMESATWESMMISAANKSLHDYVNNVNHETSAAMLRILEFEVPPITNALPLREVTNLLVPLNTNYGNAGVVCANYFGRNATALKNRIVNFEASLFPRLNVQPEERFWASAISLVLVGGTIAEELGLVKFDMPRMRDFLVHTLNKLRHVKANETLDYTNPLTFRRFIEDYVSDNRHRILLTDTIPLSGAGGRAVANLTHLPDPYMRDRWAGRWGADRRLWVDYVTFYDWLRKRNITPGNAMKGLAKFPGYKEVRAVMTKGLPPNQVRPSGQVRAMEYDCTNGPLQDLYVQ